MIRKLVSKFNRSITERVVSPRKKYEVPIKIWFEPDRNTGRLRMPVENLVITGETRDLSRSGIGFIVSAIRIQENYLVGEGRTLNVELDLPDGKVQMQIVGSRYEQVGQHISTARFLVGAKITQMSAENREAYEYFLRHGGKRKKEVLLWELTKADFDFRQISKNARIKTLAFFVLSEIRDLIFVMKEKVGVGIIGTGFARRVQIPAFLECENARIVSVASASLANAESTAKEFSIAHFTDNWRETVENEEVDLICITTPPNTHFEMTLCAIESGKHVLCEKPMAMNLAQAREMTVKAKEKQVLALIDHELRFQKGRQKAFEMLRNAAIGKIRHAKANFRAPHRGDVNAPWNWWSDKRAGGGALGAIGSHIIDSFNWFLGAEISQVFCQLQTQIKERKDSSGELRDVTTDDEANLVVRFADGDLTQDATGNISMSMTEYPKYQNRIEFFGTKGAIRIGHRGEIFLGTADASDWTEIEVDLGKNVAGVPDTGFARGFMNFAPEIVKAILSGKTEIEHAATFEDGVKVQKVLDAAHESDEKGCLVKI